MIRSLTAGLVLLLMLTGCLLLWIGVPVAGIWVSSKLADSFGAHLALALVLIVGGLIAVAPALIWLDGLYLRIELADDPEAMAFRRGGPLERMLLACLAIALIAFAIWFFFFAENPTVNVY